MISRYRGEELTIILTEAALDKSMIPLERLKEPISQHNFVYNGEETRITVSIGVSTNFADITTEKELVASADKALYKAKQDGRNKVVAYSYEQFNQDLQQ